MNLKERVSTHLNSINADYASKRYLLACSGGKDSIALFHILDELDLNFEVAHCNFGLRGKESDQDEEFVVSLGEELGVKVHVGRFDTERYFSENKLSIQEAARDQRYQYFKELMDSNDLDYLLTAHHLDDSIETFFINLIRGSGFKGLGGIRSKADKVVRPFIDTPLNEIVDYLDSNSILYREDSSNLSDKYLRNRIRHHLIPVLSEIDKDFRENMSESMKMYQKLDNYIELKVEEEMESVLSYPGQGLIQIEKKGVMEMKDPELILFRYLQPFGFNISDVRDILIGIQKNTKADYFVSNYVLTRERDYFLLKTIKPDDENNPGIIDENTSELSDPVSISIQYHPRGVKEISTDPRKAFLSLDELKYPLIVRKWHFGDYFYPLGMQNRKKLSDFFTDKKLSNHVKESTYVLESDGKVVWVIGHRIDDRFKVRLPEEPVVEFRLE